MSITLSNTGGGGNFKFMNSSNSGLLNMSMNTVTMIITAGLILNYDYATTRIEN